MYKIELVQGPKDIIDFENYRIKSFTPKSGKIKDICESQVATDIAGEEVKAYAIKKDNKTIGGMVIRPLNKLEHALKLEYLFVNKPERGKKIASFALNYLAINREKFLPNCYEIFIKATPNSCDFYERRGYELMSADAYEKRGLDKKSEGPLMQKTFR